MLEKANRDFCLKRLGTLYVRLGTEEVNVHYHYLLLVKAKREMSKKAKRECQRRRKGECQRRQNGNC